VEHEFELREIQEFGFKNMTRRIMFGEEKGGLEFIESLFHKLKERGILIMADVLVDIKISVAPGTSTKPLAVDGSAFGKTGTVGVPFSGQLSITGGTPPYHCSSLSTDPDDGTTRSLPDGLSVDDSGLISGTPTAAGDFDALIDVSDSSTPPASVRARATGSMR
jgi:hypothetical protein